MKKSKQQKAMGLLASLGGKATLKKHGKKHFIRMGKLSALARNKKKTK